jgi:hypothetical protein
MRSFGRGHLRNPVRGPGGKDRHFHPPPPVNLMPAANIPSRAIAVYIPPTKTCSNCKAKLSTSEFRPDTQYPHRLESRCKRCHSKASAKSNRKFRLKRMSAGLCISCRAPANGGRRRCDVCRARAARRTVNAAAKLRRNVLEAYGGRCTCCGLEDMDFLSLDHVNNDGAEERQLLRSQGLPTKGPAFYRWPARNAYPQDLQVLCFNRNFAEGLDGGICPPRSRETRSDLFSGPRLATPCKKP